ncbi:MAG: FMN-binding protein [Bacillota bacterium]|nr:FMN-binding protein [Bacillota bacterium]
MKKRVKILFIVIAAALVVGGAIGGKYLSDLAKYRETIEEITIGEVDLSQIEDGIYTGSAESVWVGAAVEVTVKEHRITNILLEHRHGRGEEAEVLPQRVIEAQSLQVDLISGVTSSSKIILKAIENALTSVGTNGQ